MNRSVAITDFLTPEQISEAWKLFESAEAHTFVKRCSEEFITPLLPEINKRLGQENNALYLSYVVQYIFNSARGFETKHVLKDAFSYGVSHGRE